MNRRFFLLAAPAIVAAPSLMRVSTLPTPLADRPEDVAMWAWKVAARVHDYVSVEEWNRAYLKPQILALARKMDEDLNALIADHYNSAGRVLQKV